MSENEPLKSSAKVPFEIAIAEVIDGVDIPMTNLKSRSTIGYMKAATELAHDISAETISREVFHDVLCGLAEVPIKALEPTESSRKMGKKHLHMGSMLGDAPETLRHESDKERKTVQAVNIELLALKGFDITFSQVLEILLTRWNSNCYRHIDDSKVASVVRVLLQRDDGIDAEKCEKTARGHAQ